MTKRRISKQQITRIQKNQDKHFDDTNISTSREGLVITRFGKHAEIENEHRERIHCSLRPNLDSIVAGDRVRWQPEGDKQGVVLSCYPRQTVLKRPRKNQEGKPIAANISQMMIVVAPKPQLSWLLLDSYLVIAENLGLSAVIVLSKIDLPCKAIQDELISCYQEKLSYPLVFTSRKSNYKELLKPLADQVSVFVGQSGVGKSSIISGILEDDSIEVGALSFSDLGCHTTTNSFYYHLPKGGALIDSPGIREFALWDMDIEELIAGFKEFKLLRGQCKFRNCCHKNSPGCAFIEGVKQGKILARRYENLLNLIENYGR